MLGPAGGRRTALPESHGAPPWPATLAALVDGLTYVLGLLPPRHARRGREAPRGREPPQRYCGVRPLLSACVGHGLLLVAAGAAERPCSERRHRRDLLPPHRARRRRGRIVVAVRGRRTALLRFNGTAVACGRSVALVEGLPRAIRAVRRAAWLRTLRVASASRRQTARRWAVPRRVRLQHTCEQRDDYRHIGVGLHDVGQCHVSEGPAGASPRSSRTRPRVGRRRAR